MIDRRFVQSGFVSKCFLRAVFQMDTWNKSETFHLLSGYKKITRKYVWMSLAVYMCKYYIGYYIFNPGISHDLPWVISEPHTNFSSRWVDIEALLLILCTEHNNVFHWNKNRRCHWPALILCSCLTSTSYHHRGKFVCYVLWPRSFPDLFRTRQEGCQAALCSAPAQTLYLKGTQLKTSPMDSLQMCSYFEISAWAFCNLSLKKK